MRITKNERTLRRAARDGCLWEVSAVVSEPDVRPETIEGALNLAAENGCLEVVRYLIDRCDPKANKSVALMSAIHCGYDKIAELLLPVSDLCHAGSHVLAEAAFTGNLPMVRRLVPLCDPKARESAALRAAALCSDIEMVELLMPVSDGRAAWRKLARDYSKSKIKGAPVPTAELADALDLLSDAASDRDLNWFKDRLADDLKNLPRVRARVSALAIRAVLPALGSFNADALPGDPAKGSGRAERQRL